MLSGKCIFSQPTVQYMGIYSSLHNIWLNDFKSMQLRIYLFQVMWKSYIGSTVAKPLNNQHLKMPRDIAVQKNKLFQLQKLGSIYFNIQSKSKILSNWKYRKINQTNPALYSESNI